VLRGAGLIAERRDGRQVQYRLDQQGLKPLQDWLVRYRVFWPDRIEALKQLLKDMDQ
jgi:DNA-binding transcriptional ArsR family regulator